MGAACASPPAEVTEDERSLRIFVSGQHTRLMQKRQQEWLPQEPMTATVKASMPPFNNPMKLTFPGIMTMINVPVFGPAIANAAMALFKQEGIANLAKRMNLKVPPYKLNEVVQKKMEKVHEMIHAAREYPPLAGPYKENLDRLEEFTKAFEALTPESIPNLAAWEEFIGRYVESGWEHKLHFSHLLSNFGFDDDASSMLRKMTYVWPDGEKVPYEQHALRWLSKAFSAYGPQGTVTDVVNLIFAMMPVNPGLLDEREITSTVRKFGDRLDSRAFKGLWVPSYLAMDMENDDCLCWVILEYLHRAMGTQLKVLGQLPADVALDIVESRVSQTPGVHIFRDPDSQNTAAVKKYFDIK